MSMMGLAQMSLLFITSLLIKLFAQCLAWGKGPSWLNLTLSPRNAMFLFTHPTVTCRHFSQLTFATEMLHCSRKKAGSCYSTESSKLISTLGMKQFPYRFSVSWDAREESDPLSLQGTPEYTLTVMTHIKNLLQCCVSMQTGSELGSLM